MPCEHHKDALIEVAATGAAPQDELRAHLAECASCRDAFAEEQSLFAVIDSGLHIKANTEVPVSLLPHVRAELEDAVAPRRRWMQPIVLASAGVALAFLLLLVVWPHGPTPIDVAKQTPAVPAAVMSTSGTHKYIPPPGVQITSSASSHSRALRNSTLIPSTASSHPEVLVPPDEREALAQFVVLLNERSDIAAALVAKAPVKEDAKVAVNPLEISPIEIKLLEGSETEATGGPRETP